MAVTWQQAICSCDTDAFAGDFYFYSLFQNGCELESKLNAMYMEYKGPFRAKECTHQEGLDMHRLIEEARLCLHSFSENQTLMCLCLESVPTLAYIQRHIVSSIHDEEDKNMIWQHRLQGEQQLCDAVTLRMEQSCGISGKSALLSEEKIVSKNDTTIKHSMHSEQTQCDACTLRIEQSSGFFWKSAPSWEENIASKDYTDFEHRGSGFTQVSGHEDGLLRSSNSKKLLPVRIVEVDATQKIVTLEKEDAKHWQDVYGGRHHVSSNDVLFRCTLDPKSRLLSSDVISELCKTNEYMLYDDILEVIKSNKPTKFFPREDPNKFGNDTRFSVEQQVDNFLEAFATKNPKKKGRFYGKFCRYAFRCKPGCTIQKGAKMLTDVDFSSFMLQYNTSMNQWFPWKVVIRDHLKESNKLVLLSTNYLWEQCVIHISDTSWDKPGPADLVKEAEYQKETAKLRACNKKTMQEAKKQRIQDRKDLAEEKKQRELDRIQQQTKS